MNITQQESFGIKFQGFYKLAIVDGITGKEIWKQKNWNKNLILNTGLDQIYNWQSNEVSRFASIGNGTRSNSITGSPSTGSVSNGWFVLSPSPGGIQNLSSSIYDGYTGSLYPGDVIKFADGTEVNVSSSTDGLGLISDFSASVLPTSSVSSQSFTIWKTSQTNLQNVIKRCPTTTSSYSTFAGACGTTYITNSGTVIHFRTYNFSTESVQRSYTEVGVGPSLNTIFSRILLPETVSVDVDKQLRLYYNLLITFSPTSSINSEISIGGWPVSPSTNTNAQQCIQLFATNTISSIASNGNSNVSFSPLEPASNSNGRYCFISETSGSPAPIGSYVSRPDNVISNILTKLPYTTGSYECQKYVIFGINDINSTSIYSFGLGASTAPSTFPYSTAQAYVVAFEQSQSKFDTQTLTLYFKWTWGRIVQ